MRVEDWRTSSILMSEEVRGWPNAKVFLTAPVGKFRRVGGLNLDFAALFGLTAVSWFDFVEGEVSVATDRAFGFGFSILGALRGGGGDIEAFRLRAKRSTSIALRSRPSIELVGFGGESTLAGRGRGGVSPSVVLSSSFLGSVTCLEIEGGVWSSSVVASSSLSRFMTSLDLDVVEAWSWSESAIACFRSSSSEGTSMTGADRGVRA